MIQMLVAQDGLHRLHIAGRSQYASSQGAPPTVRGAELDPSLPVKPKVARAVAGHLLALDDKTSGRHHRVRQLRRFVLDPEAGLHDELRFLLWLYPFHRQGMMTDLYHMVFGGKHEPLWISAFKTYPLALAFSTEPFNPEYRLAGVIDLTPHISTDVDGLFNLRIPTRPIVDSNWPFAPHRNGAIMSRDNGSVTTVPYVNQRAKGAKRVQGSRLEPER